MPICAFNCIKQNKEQVSNIAILLLIFIFYFKTQIYKKNNYTPKNIGLRKNILYICQNQKYELMKKSLLFIPICIGLSIFFYPTTSNSNASGSPGGKTGSPDDGGASCTGCHYAGVGTGATITTNIPSSGYIPNQVYTVTANINQTGINKFGFEITAEEANFGSAKKGNFLVTNSAETKFVNNNTAITHKIDGTSASNNMKSWSMDWEAPNIGTGAVTFYGSFMAANGDGTNSGDTYHSATVTVNEGVVNSINNISSKNQLTFNSITKTIQLLANAKVYVYSIDGRLVFSSNKEHTSLTHLSKGTYIIKSENKTQKIILN